MYYFATMKAELKFLIDFYNPLESKVIKAGSVINVEVDDNGVIEQKFWREQVKFNDISKAFELNIIKNKSKK